MPAPSQLGKAGKPGNRGGLATWSGRSPVSSASTRRRRTVSKSSVTSSYLHARTHARTHTCARTHYTRHTTTRPHDNTRHTQRRRMCASFQGIACVPHSGASVAAQHGPHAQGQRNRRQTHRTRRRSKKDARRTSALARGRRRCARKRGGCRCAAWWSWSRSSAPGVVAAACCAARRAGSFIAPSTAPPCHCPDTSFRPRL